MRADLILADFKSKTWVSDRQRQESDQKALQVMTVALMGEPAMVGMEPVVYLEMDTSPAEYVAPDEDSA
jgi:hypothetical protein